MVLYAEEKSLSLQSSILKFVCEQTFLCLAKQVLQPILLFSIIFFCRFQLVNDDKVYVHFTKYFFRIGVHDPYASSFIRLNIFEITKVRNSHSNKMLVDHQMINFKL